MSSGKWPYYTAPQIQKSANGLTHQNHQEIELDDMERAMFANSLPYDAFETPFIMLGYGSINAMKPMIVNVLHQFSEKKTTTGK
ncbi:hypothetical protein TRFO_35534 [Tritrichomonas foetus]|uniref:Uncharacterized protein n=1 Tax=Tritrichomonas foetus TaxID=1144522 RepID=A0A1J4JG45_9EUKA|nr:hypothetical protein TRFO_35534 [Tritrichomonas foetus]|eukprot:OHS98112.1 hypothetical protein TRFO_35534 [Tritrichomonas foetus]